MIIFNNLCGRLGNNIKQLSNIIDIAIEYKHNIKFNVKKLKFFDLSVIEKYFNKYNNNEIITDKHNFFILVDCHFQMTYLKKILKKEIKYYRKHF